MAYNAINQLRDINGFVITTLGARAQSPINQYFTLTASTVKTVTVPNSSARNYVAFFKYTPGTDVWMLPAATPTLTLPTGTVTETLAVLRPETALVIPGQTLQFIYVTQTGSGMYDVAVGIEYYSNTQNALYSGV